MNTLNKTLLGLIILFICVVGAGIYTNQILKQDSKVLEGHIEIIQSHIRDDNWEDAGFELLELKEYWTKKQGNWAMLQSHFEIDNIDASITRLSEYINTNTLPLAIAESALLMQYIKHIPKNVKLSLENIL